MPSDASLFLETLFGGKPDELYLLLWTLPEKRSHWFQNVESAIQFAESLRERDLYVGVGLSSQDDGSARRCPSNEVAGIVGLWADLDLKSDAHPKAALPATVEDAMKILPDSFRPHSSSEPETARMRGGFFGNRCLRVRRGPPQCQRACAPLAVAAPSECRCPRLGV